MNFEENHWIMYYYVYILFPSSLAMPCVFFRSEWTQAEDHLFVEVRWSRYTGMRSAPCSRAAVTAPCVCMNQHFSALQLTLWKLVSGPSGDLSSSVTLTAYHLSLLILSLAACPPWAIFVLRAPFHVNEQSSRVVSTVSPQTFWLSTRKSCDLLKWHIQHLEVFLLSIYAVWYKIRGNNIRFCLHCWYQMSPQGF